MLCGAALKFQLDQSQAQITQFQRFHILAEISPVGIFRTGPDGTCLYVNDRWCEITGLSQEVALQQQWTAALHWDDATRVEEDWSRAVENQTCLFSAIEEWEWKRAQSNLAPENLPESQLSKSN